MSAPRYESHFPDPPPVFDQHVIAYIPNARLDAEDATVELLARAILLGLVTLIVWGLR